MLPTHMVRIVPGLLGAFVFLTASVAVATAQQGGCAPASSYDQIARQLAQARAQARGAGCTGLFSLFQQQGICAGMTAQVKALEAQLRQARRQQQPTPHRLSNSVINFPSQERVVVPDCGKPAYRSSARVVCVRLCDGYFFPVNHSVKKKNLAKDEQKCLSQYPEGQAALYIDRSGGENIASMVSLDGKQKYGDQPFAFAFQRFYNSICPRPGAHLANAAREASEDTVSESEMIVRAAIAEQSVASPVRTQVRLVGPPYAYYFPERPHADEPPDRAGIEDGGLGVDVSSVLQ